jgi:hypothetical protein
MEPSHEWCRITAFDAGGEVTATWVLTGDGPPDLAAVDSIAKQALTATRAGGHLVLAEVAPRLRELLVLAGLPVEMQGQPECREQALRIEEVEEERHLGDPPA